MLFRCDIEPCCSYCRHSTGIGRNEVACTVRGIMADNGWCGAFRYEPTKREPEFARSLDLADIAQEDFLI